MELKEQIIKGLEHCTATSYKCEECPYFYKSEGLKSSMEVLMTDALVLINSQEQRIKELTEENERLRAKGAEWRGCADTLFEEIKKAKADTVQKMRTALIANLSPYSNYTTAQVCDLIDQIAKEMLEGEK